VLVFEPVEAPTYGIVNRLAKKSDPGLSVLREIRRTEDGIEFYTPLGNQEAVTFADWLVVGRLVARVRHLDPLHALVNEAGLSFAELRTLR